jgi:hypothetical protein
VTQRPFNRRRVSPRDDETYEHHSELLISTGHANKVRTRSSVNEQRLQSNGHLSSKDIEAEICQLRRERAHILDLLSLNWNRSNIWVELTEAKLNYIIGETGSQIE